jgi:hypothetical protein
MIYNELKTGFRWYDALDKQNRFKEYCENACTYALISPCNDLLPFQIRTNGFGTITSWKLIYLDGTISTSSVSSNVAFDFGEVPLGVIWTLSVAGYGTIATATYTTTLADAVFEMVNDINSGGIFTAIKFGLSIIITAPTGSGEAFNGTVATRNINYGGFSTNTDYPFSGGADAGIGDTLNINSCIPFLNLYTVGTNTYVQYNGGDLSGCMSEQMTCGKWYSEISDGTNILYSEVYDVQQFEDVEFSQSLLPLFTPWRFYDSIDKQNRFKEYCASDCNIFNLSTKDKLLPFQIRANNGTIGIQSWKLINLDGDCEIILDTTLVQIVSTSDGDRIIYDGSAISGLPCGDYYVVIDDGITYWYSELIKIINETDTDQYLMTDDGVQLTNDDGQYLTID